MANETKELEKTKDTAEGVVMERTKNTVTYTPNVDILETKNGLEITADLPGAGENDVNVTLENDVLSIEAQVTSESMNGYKLSYREYGVGDYRRAFTINEAIDGSKIEAKMKDGVLHIVLPKAEAAKPKSIPIHKG
ncbi:MAG TPA: Hsp20/alpha crystallin family protein [Deltaproteobacteria bacterium]|nr:Hsp20/alpha crystallin family protein [Deltaproteobacteria bacterium]HPJ94345.1 Hsp20/alpha crystallin family protein [Deltaproteobacteria bacterium]HPR52359.1 Hsp20/alpha crystallin family protein [Deltaproteobacteria bacterium]